MPTWERKIRVIMGWVLNVVLGRDIVNLSALQDPRAAFEEFASRPKPPVTEAAQPVEAAKKPAAKKAAKPKVEKEAVAASK